jgi:hypothetical protein
MVSITNVLGRWTGQTVVERDGDFLLDLRRYDPLRGGVRAALRPGGRFLLEMVSITNVLGRWTGQTVVERDGDFLLELRRYDPLRGGVDTEFVAVRDGATRRYPIFIRSPTYTELRDWLLDAGFSSVEGFGEDGEPLTSAHRRTLWLARA